MPKRTTLGSEFGDLFKKVKDGIAADPPNSVQKGDSVTEPQPSAKAAPQVRPGKGAERKGSKARKGAVPNHGDLSIYGGTSSGRPRQEVAAGAPVLSLSDVTADMKRLVVRVPEARSLRRGYKRNDDSDPAGQAILGLDFGTAFTKAVINWRQRHYVVKWSDAVACEDAHLLPSMFSRSSSGEVALGIVDGWRPVHGIKMGLLQAGPQRASAAELDAVVFVALAIQHARAWFKSAVQKQGAKVPEWRLNTGLPAVSWQNPTMHETWRRVSACAWALSERLISMASAVTEFGRGHTNLRIDVVPEFAAQLAPYLRSPQRQHDLHGLLDVGAGTVDVVAFNSHWDQKGDVLPIFGALVEPLGVHHLIGALAGSAGQEVSWVDSDARLSDREIGGKTGESPETVAARRSVFEKELRATVRQIVGTAKNRYRTSPIWRTRAGMPFFLCGGGSANPCFEAALKEVEGYVLSLRRLPCPDSIMGDVDDDNFHRVSVAYGLSQLPKNIGRIVPSDQSPPDPPPRVVERRDRDDDR